MRIPLYVKLMASYLLVVGLVVVPTTIYLRTTQRHEARNNLERDMRAELAELAGKLSTIEPVDLEATAEATASLRHRRLTVIGLDGRVLADSAVAKATMDNQGKQPEFLGALSSADGFATAERHSDTVDQDLFYVTERFPLSGPAQGVVRLSVPLESLVASEGRASFFFNQVVALALSAAILLSLVAALVVSRPLRRVTQVARAFAAGDFGAPLDGMPSDEVGDVAQAIGDLAAQLRGKLLAGGVDRATLQALLDELPVAVVIYEDADQNAFIGAGARMLLDLEPENEQARVKEILEDDGQAPLVAQVLANGEAREARVSVPWLADKPFVARWIAVFGPDGTRRPALVLTDRTTEQRLEVAETRLAEIADLLLRSSRELKNAKLGVALLEHALSAEALTPLLPARAEMVEAAGLGALCRAAVEDLGPMLREAGMEVELRLDEAEAVVADATGRCQIAVRTWLAAAVAQPGPFASKLCLSDDPVDGGIRLSLPCSPEAATVDRVARTLRALGGDAGLSQVGERRETWLLLPRA